MISYPSAFVEMPLTRVPATIWVLLECNQLCGHIVKYFRKYRSLGNICRVGLYAMLGKSMWNCCHISICKTEDRHRVFHDLGSTTTAVSPDVPTDCDIIFLGAPAASGELSANIFVQAILDI